MTLSKNEGLILKVMSFGDYDQIVTLFTAHQGIIKLVVKRALQAKKGQAAATSPLSEIQVVYRLGKSDLATCYEISLLNQNIKLREKLENLEVAADLLQVTLATQVPQKAAPQLYSLLLTYLKKIPLLTDPFLLAASYRLKLLRHEGLWNLQVYCSQCGTQAETVYFNQGICYCSQHRPASCDLYFDQEEWQSVQVLAFGKSFTELQLVLLTPTFYQKIKLLFDEILK